MKEASGFSMYFQSVWKLFSSFSRWNFWDYCITVGGRGNGIPVFSYTILHFDTPMNTHPFQLQRRSFLGRPSLKWFRTPGEMFTQFIIRPHWTKKRPQAILENLWKCSFLWKKFHKTLFFQQLEENAGQFFCTIMGIINSAEVYLRETTNCPPV